MDKITKAINCPYEAHRYPWKRLIYLMETDGIDVLSDIQPNAERAKIAYFSKPYGYQHIALFVRKGESEKYPINSLEELNQYKFLLGVRDSVDYGPEFKRMLDNPNFNTRLDWLAGPTNPKKLAGKRIDGLLMDPLAAPHVFREQGVYDKLERHPMPFLKAGQLTLMLNKNNVSPRVVKKINEAIDDLKISQQYLPMLLKYEDVMSTSK
ncbi:transporter substrate-binding domain-containing protein [Alkalimarinus alittae]|uniref:Transporter substrate-binding domain-containing protein n=2 Tax=Alkalimarinus alittae TaxID=2961619 RepID=A0ABY6N7A6_9ALTE|nr:transporter substrate-binding domain-containing protein [Alkalimarinus alittae]